jgi:hypothetical protein
MTDWDQQREAALNLIEATTGQTQIAALQFLISHLRERPLAARLDRDMAACLDGEMQLRGVLHQLLQKL